MTAATPHASTPPTPLARLYGHMWAHALGARGRLAAAMALMGGSQVLKLALPWLAAQAIDALQTGGRGGLETAARWIVAILGLHVAAWALHGPARVLERSVALRVRRSVADLLYLRLARAPLTWHEQHHSGDLQHRAAQAAQALCGFTQSQFIYLQNLIHLVGPLLALWWLSTLTGAVALAGFMAIAAVALRFDRALMALAVRENDAERRYAARLLDFVGNISAVAGLRLQQATRSLLDARLRAVFVPMSRSIVLTEWKWCAVDLLTTALCWALVVVYALASLGSTAGGGTLLIGSLFMVHQYSQQVASVLGSMAANYQSLAHFQADSASAETIRCAPQADGPPPGEPVPGDWQRIELHGIGFTHPPSADGRSRGGVHGVTLTLRRGERLALIGPSGCGKSTLLRVLAGLYDAQRGHLTIDGVAHTQRRQLGEQATLIPQETEIFEATVLENLLFGQVTTAADLHGAVHVAAFADVLATLPQGLETPLSERGFNLSGGQRQRLALARGVLAARASSLLLLDEPTSALDPVIEATVHQRLGPAFGGACLIAAVHRLSLLPHFDRVVLMDRGGIVDVGTAAELQARQPHFAALCAGLGLSGAPAAPSARAPA